MFWTLQRRHETEDQQLLKQQTDMDKQKGTVFTFLQKPCDHFNKDTTETEIK